MDKDTTKPGRKCRTGEYAEVVGIDADPEDVVRALFEPNDRRAKYETEVRRRRR